MKTNHVPRMPVKSDHLAVNESVDRAHRVRNQSCSASSTLSSASSISSSALSNLNQNYLADILIVYPNGLQISKNLDARKAVYDILIELSATAKLIPTNYSLKLFSKDESDSSSNNYKLIDYTPNQTIGHLNPAKITIVPKTTTLKHQQHQLFPLENEAAKLAGQTVNLNSYAKSVPVSKTPFELTIRLGVNLPFNQKTAVRVKPDISLKDLLETICKEANLDPSRYDLVLNSKTIQASAQQKFSSFNTNEVTLAPKNYEKTYSRLNSKSSIATFNQNSSKSRTQKKITSNTKNINPATTDNKSIKKLKSKSELDLSIGSSGSSTFRGSMSNLSIKSSMFSFFTRKKNRKSKSKASLYDDIASLNSNSLKHDHVSSTSSIKSTSSSQIDNYYYLTKTNKKRPAPPPPSGHNNLNSVPEGNETPRTENLIDKNQARSKSVVDDRNDLNDLDRETLQKIIALTKKKKKAAPLPPSQKEQKVLTDLSPRSLENSIKIEDKDEKCSLTPSSFPSPSLSDSSSAALSNGSDNSAKLDEKKHLSPSIKSNLSEDMSKVINIKTEEKSRNIDCDSLNMPSMTNSLDKQFILTSDNSSLPIKDKLEESKDEMILEEIKKSNDDSILISDENCVRSFYGAVTDHKIFSEDDQSDLDSIKALNSPIVTTSPLNQSKYSVQNMSNQITKVVINKNLEPKNKSHNNSATQLKLETKIPDVLVEATNRSSVQPFDAEPEIILSKTDSDEETQIDINLIDKFQTPKKQTAVIEVRPEFETSSLIKIADKSIDEKKTNTTPRLNLNLKSPVSPPPQFPALKEKDINEQHQNYTVVRHGDIIEKNGIYYSTDGTVRGYSGIVKKLANSKVLNEVFQKQQELEQQHEREYKLELERRELEKQKQNNRSSLCAIVENEKKLASNQIKTVQYRKNIDSRPVVKTTMEDELVKKLECRRQTIANQINLEVDTNSARTASTNSSPVLDNFSAQNSPQSYFMSQNLHSISQRKNTPSFVMSAKARDSNTNAIRINQDNMTQSRTSLFEEIKSSMSELESQLDKSKSLSQLSTFQPKIVRPNVAPKNFNSNTKENFENKKQSLNARDDLLDSIKSFSVASLKKINQK